MTYRSILLCALSTFAICGNAAEHTIRMNASKASFTPALVVIAPGDTVKFVKVGKSATVNSASLLVPEGAFQWCGVPGKAMSAKLSRPGLEPSFQ
jgi:plastocyanin